MISPPYLTAVSWWRDSDPPLLDANPPLCLWTAKQQSAESAEDRPWRKTWSQDCDQACVENWGRRWACYSGMALQMHWSLWESSSHWQGGTSFAFMHAMNSDLWFASFIFPTCIAKVMWNLCYAFVIGLKQLQWHSQVCWIERDQEHLISMLLALPWNFFVMHLLLSDTVGNQATLSTFVVMLWLHMPLFAKVCLSRDVLKIETVT